MRRPRGHLTANTPHALHQVTVPSILSSCDGWACSAMEPLHGRRASALHPCPPRALRLQLSQTHALCSYSFSKCPAFSSLPSALGAGNWCRERPLCMADVGWVDDQRRINHAAEKATWCRAMAHLLRVSSMAANLSSAVAMLRARDFAASSTCELPIHHRSGSLPLSSASALDR
jgi:hypothetical protein